MVKKYNAVLVGVYLCNKKKYKNLHRVTQRLHRVTQRVEIVTKSFTEDLVQIGFAFARRYFSASSDQM